MPSRGVTETNGIRMVARRAICFGPKRTRVPMPAASADTRDGTPNGGGVKHEASILHARLMLREKSLPWTRHGEGTKEKAVWGKTRNRGNSQVSSDVGETVELVPWRAANRVKQTDSPRVAHG